MGEKDSYLIFKTYTNKIPKSQKNKASKEKYTRTVGLSLTFSAFNDFKIRSKSGRYTAFSYVLLFIFYLTRTSSSSSYFYF